MITAVINMKGGVGKTTLCANLAIGLAKYHDKRVLLIDLDPQSNLTQSLLKPDKYRKYLETETNCTIKDIFIDRPTESVGLAQKSKQTTSEIIPTVKNSTVRIYGKEDSASFCDLIPSRLELMEAETLERGVENRLGIFLDKIKDAYDLIFLDCPPTMGLFTLSAFIASNSYLVPLKPDYLSSVGLPLINKAITIFQKNFKISLKYLGLIFTMVQSTNLMRDTMIEIKQDPNNKCFDQILSHSTSIAETVRDNQNIFDISARYSEEMVTIVDEFVTRMDD
jgi:chromosome partitioning protein